MNNTSTDNHKYWNHLFLKWAVETWQLQGNSSWNTSSEILYICYVCEKANWFLTLMHHVSNMDIVHLSFM